MDELERPGRPVWRQTSTGTEISLRSALAHVLCRGALPSGATLSRSSFAEDPACSTPEQGAPDHLLSALLKPAEKRILELLSRWPLIARKDLGRLRDRSESVMRKLTSRLKQLNLVAGITLEGRPRLCPEGQGSDRHGPEGPLGRRRRRGCGRGAQVVTSAQAWLAFGLRNLSGTRRTVTPANGLTVSETLGSGCSSSTSNASSK